MSKTLFSITACVLSSIILIGCGNGINKLEQDPLKGEEDKFLNTEVIQNEEDIVFYDLIDPNAPKGTDASPLATSGASEPVLENEMKPDPLPPKVLENILRSQEIEYKKAEALESIAESKRLEAEILNQINQTESVYTYTNDHD